MIGYDFDVRFELSYNCHSFLLESDFELSTIRFGGPNGLCLPIKQSGIASQNDLHFNAHFYVQRFPTSHKVIP